MRSTLILLTSSIQFLHLGQAEAIKPRTLESITITADKTERKLGDSHSSISVFNQFQIKDGLIQGTEDLIQQTPNLYSFTPKFGSFLNIRGVGGRRPEETGVGFIVDGVHQQNFSSDVYSDIERIEVIKGPQGTLHGRNTEAGVIQIITQKPLFERESQVKLGLDNHQTLKLGLLHNDIINKDLATRVSFQQSRSEGGIHNDTLQLDDGNSNEFNRGIIKFLYKRYGELNLKLDIDRNRGGFDNATPIELGKNDITYNDKLGEVNNHAHGITLNYALNQSDYQWYFTTGFRDSTDIMEVDLDLDSRLTNPAASLIGRFSDSYRDFSQEVRFHRELKQTSYTLGLYYLHRDTGILSVLLSSQHPFYNTHQPQ